MYTYNTTQTVFLPFYTALLSLLLKSWIQLFHSVLCHAILRKLRPHKSPLEQFLPSPPSNWGATLTPWTPCLPSSALYFSIHHAPEKTRQRLPLCCVASGLAWFYDLMTCASESCSYCSISMEYKISNVCFIFFVHNILLHNLCSFVWFDAIKMMFVYFWFYIKSVRIGVRSQCLQFQCFVGW